MNILLIGSGAREHALARALKRSRHDPTLFCFGPSRNPGILKLAHGYAAGSLTDLPAIIQFAQAEKIDWAFVGPEAPLASGVVDALASVGIRALGPTKSLARIETSKNFARQLLTESGINACPRWRSFITLAGAADWLKELNENYVVKADGLMGGKGVKVSGDHLHSHAEALAWCQEIMNKGMGLLIEEKLIGQEFSLMSFSDGEQLAHMPAVQDHKRAFSGDTGPNTGGMGSYSDANHSLPFLTNKDIEEAQTINQTAIAALNKTTGEMYKGILYGGFMATRDGVKLIEYNARLGDPEAMNVLAILESDFVDLCVAILTEKKLTPDLARFAYQATVCKYAVPVGYPDKPVKDKKIDTAQVQNPDQVYYAAVDERLDGLYLTGARAVAVVGMAGTIAEAERTAEEAIQRIKGPLYHRADIGTEELINQRVEMMNKLRIC